MKTILSSCVWKDRYQKPYKKTDWLFIILLILMTLFLTGITLYYKHLTDSIVAVCGCPQVPYGLQGIALGLDQDTKEFLRLLFNQQLL